MIRAKINEKLELKFRELAMRRFGYAKGALSRAIEEAILRWIAFAESEDLSFEGDPVKIIEGMLSDIDIDSVELQHMVKYIWISKVLGDVSNRH